MGDRVHDRLPHRLQRVFPSLLPPPSGIDPGLYAGVPAYAVEGSLDDAALGEFAALGEAARLSGIARSVRFRPLKRQRHRRPAHRRPLSGVVVLLGSRVCRRADARLRQVPVGARAEQEQAGRARHGVAAALDHDLRVHEQPDPGCLVLRVGAVLLAQVAEVVDEAAPVEIGERGAGYRLAVVLEPSRLLVKARLLFIGSVSRRRSGTHLRDPCRSALRLVRLVRRVRGEGYDADGHTLVPLDSLPEGNRGRPNVGAGDLHDPLLDLPPVAGETGHRTAAFDPKEDAASLQVEQGGDLPGHPLGAQVVPLELDAGTLPGADQIGQTVPIHRSTSTCGASSIFMHCSRGVARSVRNESAAAPVHAGRRTFPPILPPPRRVQRTAGRSPGWLPRQTRSGG